MFYVAEEFSVSNSLNLLPFLLASDVQRRRRILSVKFSETFLLASNVQSRGIILSVKFSEAVAIFAGVQCSKLGNNSKCQLIPLACHFRNGKARICRFNRSRVSARTVSVYPRTVFDLTRAICGGTVDGILEMNTYLFDPPRHAISEMLRHKFVALIGAEILCGPC